MREILGPGQKTLETWDSVAQNSNGYSSGEYLWKQGLSLWEVRWKQVTCYSRCGAEKWRGWIAKLRYLHICSSDLRWHNFLLKLWTEKNSFAGVQMKGATFKGSTWLFTLLLFSFPFFPQNDGIPTHLLPTSITCFTVVLEGRKSPFCLNITVIRTETGDFFMMFTDI